MGASRVVLGLVGAVLAGSGAGMGTLYLMTGGDIPPWPGNPLLFLAVHGTALLVAAVMAYPVLEHVIDDN